MARIYIANFLSVHDSERGSRLVSYIETVGRLLTPARIGLTYFRLEATWYDIRTCPVALCPVALSLKYVKPISPKVLCIEIKIQKNYLYISIL